MRNRNLQIIVALSIVAGFLTSLLSPVSAASYYSPGSLNGQNGWDGGSVSGHSISFNNITAGAADVVNTQAHTGSQSWLFAQGGGSPGAGTPFSPAVVTAGAPDQGAAGDMVVISFAFKAAVPGDGSRVSIYEGAAKRDDRTGSNIYLETTSASSVHLYMVPALEESPYFGSNVNLGNFAPDNWHVLVMTTHYPTTNPNDMSSWGVTTYVVDGVTVGSATPWPHWWRYRNGIDAEDPSAYPYAPGSSIKFSSSYNDASHHGFYFDDVSFRVINSNTHATVGAFSTSFENVGNSPAILTAPVEGSFTTSFNRINITFNEDLNNPAGDILPDDVTNPNNYLLFQKGANAVYDTVECSTGLQGDDINIPISSAVYENNGGDGLYQVTLAVNNGTNLAAGDYRLLVCGTTSIVNTDGAPLNGEPGTDSHYDFTIQAASTTTTASTGSASAQEKLPLPVTGFAPGRTTILPAQLAAQKYADLGSLWLEIPSLGVNSTIVGVEQTENGWDVSWLGNEIGWLNGTAFPSWQGNSVLTGHVYDANGLPGPFVAIDQLKWGDQVIVHAFDVAYVYEVRQVKRISASATSTVTKHEDRPWVTLLTCSGYDPASDTYLYREMVRAVLVGKH